MLDNLTVSNKNKSVKSKKTSKNLAMNEIAFNSTGDNRHRKSMK